MNCKVLTLGFIAIAFALLCNCTEDSDCNFQCPTNDSEIQPAIKILVATVLNSQANTDIIPDCLEATDLLPDNSEIVAISLNDTIPPLGFFQKFDAILTFTDTWPAGWITNRIVFGNVLADYIDH